MRAIVLTQGKRAVVDDADYEWLNQWNWYATKTKSGNFYANRKIGLGGGKYLHISMARQILGLWPGDPLQADHIHHNTLDNRRSELRKCTNQQNSLNRAEKKEIILDNLARPAILNSR